MKKPSRLARFLIDFPSLRILLRLIKVLPNEFFYRLIAGLCGVYLNMGTDAFLFLLAKSEGLIVDYLIKDAFIFETIARVDGQFIGKHGGIINVIERLIRAGNFFSPFDEFDVG